MWSGSAKYMADQINLNPDSDGCYMAARQRAYSVYELFLRSLFFFLVSTINTIGFGLLCLLVKPFSLPCRYRVVRCFLRCELFLLAKICHVRYQVTGLDNIPIQHNGIIFSKHQSTWETFFLPTLFHDVAIILKKELLWVPFFGWGLAVTDPIAINRNNSQTALQQVLVRGASCLQAGRWVLIFPEGTRIPSGQVGQYHLGGARLAAATGAPVLPIAHNAGDYWPKRKFLKYPGTIQVMIGPLITSEHKLPKIILQEAKDWIEHAMLKISITQCS